MTPEQQAAYVFSRSVAAMAEIQGMAAENMQREALGQSMAYDHESFCSVIDTYGISHRAVTALFLGLE